MLYRTVFFPFRRVGALDLESLDLEFVEELTDTCVCEYNNCLPFQ